jgi:hypothetical protein
LLTEIKSGSDVVHINEDLFLTKFADEPGAYTASMARGVLSPVTQKNPFGHAAASKVAREKVQLLSA